MSTEELSTTLTPAASADAGKVITATVDGDSPDGAEVKAEEAPKPEKTAHELRIEELERGNKRMQRGIDRRTRQLSDANAQLALTRGQNQANYQPTADDSEPLSLTRAQVDELVNARAQQLAPTLRENALEAERRQSVIQSLAKTWGQEKFDEISSDLDEVFGGLTDRSGKPKPATEAIFEADEPAKVIEWLSDPENSDEAERISKLGAVQAGKAIAKLEATLSTMTPRPTSKASKAPAPLEALRGTGPVGTAPDESKMTDSQWEQFNLDRKRKRA